MSPECLDNDEHWKLSNHVRKNNRVIYDQKIFTSNEPCYDGYKAMELKKNIDNKKIGETLDEFIQKYIKDLLNKGKESSDNSVFIETDNLAEIVEKLCILHCRMWYLEDQISNAKNNDEIAQLKAKIDNCFKQRRPKLVSALNKMMEAAVLHSKSLVEDSVKLYKGFEQNK